MEEGHTECNLDNTIRRNGAMHGCCLRRHWAEVSYLSLLFNYCGIALINATMRAISGCYSLYVSNSVLFDQHNAAGGGLPQMTGAT